MVLDNGLPQEKIIKGDARSVSIAAASIIAKVYRDEWMAEYGERYPLMVLLKMLDMELENIYKQLKNKVFYDTSQNICTN